MLVVNKYELELSMIWGSVLLYYCFILFYWKKKNFALIQTLKLFINSARVYFRKPSIRDNTEDC